MSRIVSNGGAVAIIGVLLFVGVGVALASQVNCGVGPAVDGERGSETARRNDDSSFFAHMVCVAKKPQHNR